MRIPTTALVFLLGCLPCAAQQPSPSQAAPRQPPASKEAAPASLPEQEIGRRFSVKPESLPAPKATTVASSRSLTLPYAGQVPRVPDGFKVSLFAGGLTHPGVCWCCRTAT